MKTVLLVLKFTVRFCELLRFDYCQLLSMIINLLTENEQVARGRVRAKLETISIKVQRYSGNNAQYCIFWPPYVRIGRNVSG